jgi:predicted metal-dependent HD superfamily phosphohydrolase
MTNRTTGITPLDHIARCLATLDQHRPLASSPDRVEMALWTHGVIYDPKANDNEVRSIDGSMTPLTAAGLAPRRLAVLKALIRSTARRERTAALRSG